MVQILQFLTKSNISKTFSTCFLVLYKNIIIKFWKKFFRHFRPYTKMGQSTVAGLKENFLFYFAKWPNWSGDYFWYLGRPSHILRYPYPMATWNLKKFIFFVFLPTFKWKKFLECLIWLKIEEFGHFLAKIGLF